MEKKDLEGAAAALDSAARTNSPDVDALLKGVGDDIARAAAALRD